MNTAAIRHAVDLARIASHMAVSWSFAGYPEVAAEWRAKREHHMTTARQLKADQPRAMEPKQ